jgi:hypothetical protein
MEKSIFSPSKKLIVLLSIATMISLLFIGVISNVKAEDYNVTQVKINKSFDEKAVTLKSEFIKDDKDEYGKYDISYFNTSISKDENVLSTKLTNNTDTCGKECYAIGTIELFKNTSLIDDIQFYKIENGIKTISNIRNYYILFYNGTVWDTYPLGKVIETGNYTIKLIGHKRPSWSYDWQIKTNGFWTTEWAIWGNISAGDEAEVLLQTPTNNYIDDDNLNINYSCFVNITNGAEVKNLSYVKISSGNYVTNETTTTFNTTLQNITTEYIYDDFNDGVLNLSLWENTSNSVNLREESGIILLYSFPVRTAGHVTLTSTNLPVLSRIWNISFDIIEQQEGNTQIFSFGGQTYLLTNNGNYILNRTINSNIFSLWLDGINKTVIIPSNNIVVFDSNDPDTDGTQGLIRFDNFKYAIETPSSVNHTFIKSISQNTTWTCQSCDSDNVCGYANENRTTNLNVGPSITVISPSSTITSSSIIINFSITDDLNNLSYCYYNITRGASTEKVNTVLNISTYPYLNDSYNLSGQSTYNLNTWCNDSMGNNVTNIFPFTYSIIPVTPPSGGGSSGNPVIITSGSGSWSMETDSKGSSYQLNLIPGATRTKSIYFKNSGTTIRNIKLTCKSSNTLCDYLTFSKNEFALPNSKDIITSISFSITLPKDIDAKDFSGNIYATDDLLNQGYISISGTTKYNIFIEFATKLTSSKAFGDTKFPYFLIFIFSFLLVGAFFNYIIIKPMKLPGAFSFISAFIASFLLLIIM